MNIQTSLPRILIYQNKGCGVLVNYLKYSGFSVIQTTEENVLDKLRNCNYDLCILGHFRANIPGDLTLLHFIRGINNKMPVIFLSDLFEYNYIIDAFNAGVDDYVVQPYNIDELVCRIKALLRRCGIKSRSVESSYKIGDYTFDTEDGMLIAGNTRLKLTEKESKILGLLCAYKGELLPKDVLLNSAWGEDNYFNRRSLDVHMCLLRKYFEHDRHIIINTIRGLGYSLVIKDNKPQ